jgi:hypothetical protein
VSDPGGMGTGPLGRDEMHMRRDAVPLMHGRWKVAYRGGVEPKQVALVRMRCGQRNVWLEVGESVKGSLDFSIGAGRGTTVGRLSIVEVRDGLANQLQVAK